MSKKTLTDTPFVRGKQNETDCSLCKFCTPRDQKCRLVGTKGVLVLHKSKRRELKRLLCVQGSAEAYTDKKMLLCLYRKPSCEEDIISEWNHGNSKRDIFYNPSFNIEMRWS